MDARLVALAGAALIFTACLLDAFVNPAWNRDQFYLGQVLQAFGMAFIIMPILMLVTNVLKPEEGPFASALFNTPRGVAEAIGVWFLQLIVRLRGGFHRERLADTLGQAPLGLLERSGPARSALGVVTRQGGLSLSGRGGGYGQLINQQVSVLTTEDTFVLMAGLCVILSVMLFIPERTLPPRIALAAH